VSAYGVDWANFSVVARAAEACWFGWLLASKMALQRWHNMYIATRSCDLTTSLRMRGLLSLAACQQLAARRGCASDWRQMDYAQYSKRRWRRRRQQQQQQQ
jgi:hypothetical protein